MEHACVAAGLFPHPPIMLPEIGGDELQKIASTVRAVQAAARLIVSQKPETLVIMSPHNYVFPDGATLLEAPRLYGNLDAFGYPELAWMSAPTWTWPKKSLKSPPRKPISTASTRPGATVSAIPSTSTSTFVPLYYLRQAGFTGQVVLMAPRFDAYDSMSLLGDLVVQAAARLGRVSPSSRPVTCRTASCPVRPTAIRQKGPSSTRPSWKPCRNRTRPSSRP